jgi:hypothetical protein
MIMIIIYLFILILISYLCNFYKKKYIVKNMEIINNDYITLFDNIFNILDNYNINKFNFINLTNNTLITYYAKLYKLQIKYKISNNCIIYIENYDNFDLNKILKNYNNIIIILSSKNDDLINNFNINIYNYYLYSNLAL